MHKTILRLLVLILFTTVSFLQSANAQQSVARRWNELLLQAIREDFARPPIQARNLFHTSMAMYDAWAVYDTTAETLLLGKTYGGYYCPFEGISAPADVEAARRETISYAVYRILYRRFLYSPNAFSSISRFSSYMSELGYDPNVVSIDYGSGSPAALGNYIGYCVLSFGQSDGSNEQGNYANTFVTDRIDSAIKAVAMHPFTTQQAGD